jgi:RNA polymerase sigma factor (sigma-70 family)
MLRGLVERARQGDEEAFAALTNAVGDRCMAVAFRILRDVDLAEDAVQVAFVTGWQNLRSLRDPDRFEGWLHRLLVRACYAEARRSRRRTMSLMELSPESGYASDDILTIDDRDQIERGFRRLSPEQRAVLVFHHYLGLSLPEVAFRLGIPLGTVKSRLHYASAALRAALEADARTPHRSKERPA